MLVEQVGSTGDAGWITSVVEQVKPTVGVLRLVSFETLSGVSEEKVSIVADMLATPSGKVSVDAGEKNPRVLDARLVPAVQLLRKRQGCELVRKPITTVLRSRCGGHYVNSIVRSPVLASEVAAAKLSRPT